MEGKINFLPTYKRDMNGTGYVNKKDQCPSFTDRIMVKNNSSGTVEILEYSSHETHMGSDHRPVFTRTRVTTKPQNYISPLTLITP